MRTARSKNGIFIADDSDEDGGLLRRQNAKMRMQTLRQKRKVMERDGVVPPAAPKRQWLRPPLPSSLPPPREVDMSALQFLFEKRLKHSDVKDRGRVVIPKEFALKHFPQLDSKEGMFISMDDVTTPKLWTFRYGFWSNNSGRIHVLEHACEFFAMHGMQNGDFLMFYVDPRVGRFAIGSRKANAHAVRDDHRALEGAPVDNNMASVASPVDNNMASVASTSVTGAVSSIEDEDDSLEYFFKDLLDDDFFDLPKL